MTQIERTEGTVFVFAFFNVLNNCKCEDSNDGAFGVILLLF